tara:strand:+ start:63 stop:308 length:246 start_codon:yes stop_codon:yes gene_type:complete
MSNGPNTSRLTIEKKVAQEIAEIKKQLQEAGKEMSDEDQKRLKSIFTRQAQLNKSMARGNKYGGLVKKYAKGGGVRKARYK